VQSPARSASLPGRLSECQALDEFTATVRSGRSATLVLAGEAGIGKSALLAYAIDGAGDLQVARVAGAESESHLAFAGLHRLLRPFLDRMDALPGPQRTALDTAFGLVDGGPADRFMVGLATLTLLADAARDLPLVCAVDDAHWLDQESAAVLAFVARRLYADSIGFLIATRDDGRTPTLDGLPVLAVAGLDDAAARDLLTRSAAVPIAPRIAARILAETRGNPLALIELAGELSRDQLAGAAPLPDRLPLSERLEALFRRRIGLLPAATRSLLLIVSVAAPDDDIVVWRAAGLLGVSAHALDAAVAEGILMTAPALAFRHPLIRSAVYSGAPPAQRRRVHAALAEAIDREADPDRRAWHLAEATVGLDEDVAGELEHACRLARGRGGQTMAATFMSRAAGLSPDWKQRCRRLLVAGEAYLVAGDVAAAQRCLTQATSGPTTPVLDAAVHRLRAATAWFGGRAPAVSSAMMLAVAADTNVGDEQRYGMLLEALTAALVAGRNTVGTTVAEVAEAALRTPRGGRVTTVRLLLDAFATRIAIGYTAAVPLLRAAGAALRSDQQLTQASAPFAVIGHITAEDLWDADGFLTIVRHGETVARQRGELHTLTAVLDSLATHATLCGDFDRAGAYYAEGAEIGAMIGIPEGDTTRQVELLAWRGLEAQARAAADSAITVWEAQRGYAIFGDHARNSLAVLELGLGRYAEALAWVVPTFHDDTVAHGNRALPDLIEAAVRVGDLGMARTALHRLDDRANASGTKWALGTLARSRALLADDDEAEALYREAVEILAGTPIATDLARTHLLYGEWLRRQKRRREAREQLQIAYDAFADMGATAFAERARIELLATGQQAGARVVHSGYDLTLQESRVAVLAAQGATNTEIATRLFITASTVEYHLNKIFRKLDITSRRQLRTAIRTASDQPSAPARGALADQAGVVTTGDSTGRT
jgi:DNA-binding CsgD family transcriptional regulator